MLEYFYIEILLSSRIYVAFSVILFEGQTKNAISPFSGIYSLPFIQFNQSVNFSTLAEILERSIKIASPRAFFVYLDLDVGALTYISIL